MSRPRYVPSPLTFADLQTAANVPIPSGHTLGFKIDSLSGGTQQGATIEQLNITVSNGDYRVNLDFGSAVFSGADRYLEVSYRLAGGSNYTTQTPRQQLTSVPYAIRSLTATSADGLSTTCAGCVTSTQIQSV